MRAILKLMRTPHAADRSAQKEGVTMNRKLKLTLLACALGAASVTAAETSNDVSAPNDNLLSGTATTPTMPVVVSPPTDDTRPAAANARDAVRQRSPVVRSIGSDADSASNVLSDGPATGASAPIDRTPTGGGPP